MTWTMRRYRRGLGPLAGGLLLSLHAIPAHAQGWFAQAGAELDDADGYVISGALGGSVSTNTSWDLAASRSDTSTDIADLLRTAFGASLHHDFGNVGVRLGLRGWTDEDLVQTQSTAVAVDLHNESWSFALRTEFRHSDFDPLDINRTIVRGDGSTLTITGSADCDVDDTAIGARLSFSSAEWYFDVSGMSYDYDDFGCDLNVAPLDVLRRATRDEFIQLADRATDLLSLGAGRRLLAETSLLDSHLGTRLRYTRGLHTYSVSYDRVEDIFFGRAATTLTGGIAFLLESGNEIEVYTGVTDSDSYANVVFLGISLLMVR